MSAFRRIPLPIGKTRLFVSIFMAFVSGFFILFGSINHGWFTLTRQIYFVFGVASGLLLGVLETRIVIPKLVKNTEAFVLQVVPIATALFGLPLLLVIAFFGVSEYLQFGVYAFFPFITATAAMSGWYFSRFEKENKVSVFMSYFGFEYWTQPALDYSELFHHFLRDVASKNPYHFWGQLGSSRGYIGYSKIFMDMLKEKTEIDPSTRKDLIKNLKTMNKYRYVTLSVLAFFLGSISVIMILIFGTTFGYINVNFNVADVVGPGCGIILFSFFIGVFVLMKSFQRTISRLLANIDTSELALST